MRKVFAMRTTDAGGPGLPLIPIRLWYFSYGDRGRPPRPRGADGGGNARVRRRALPSLARRGLLLPEGGLGDHGHADAARARDAVLHARHRRPLPRDRRDVAEGRGP